MSPFEGLRVSVSPCTQVLSVSGFFDRLGLFPLGRVVYSERKEASFLTQGGLPSSTLE